MAEKSIEIKKVIREKHTTHTFFFPLSQNRRFKSFSNTIKER